VYTINDPVRAMQLIHRGVNGIITNHLSLIGRLPPAS
jgi:hypothetical protein